MKCSDAFRPASSAPSGYALMWSRSAAGLGGLSQMLVMAKA